MLLSGVFQHFALVRCFSPDKTEAVRCFHLTGAMIHNLLQHVLQKRDKALIFRDLFNPRPKGRGNSKSAN